ncbi:MAG: MFS transporter [Methanosarcinaceae archaeon]|nr:MFS transporter [Methanosarcinaceae archaeon]
MKNTVKSRTIESKASDNINRELYILSLSRFFEDMGTGMLVTLIPLYIVNLHTSILPDMPLILKAGIVMTVFGLFNAIAQPIMGKLSDKIDRRKPFIIFGLVGYTVFSLMYAHVTSYEQLLVLRIMQGITVGATIPAIITMVTHLSTPATRGKAVGIYSTIRGLGFGLGPVIGGAVATYYSFNAAFYLCAAFGLVSFILVNLLVKETHSTCIEKVMDEDVKNGKGSILVLAGAMFMMMVGIMMIVALLPEYEIRLGASEFSLGIALSAYMLARLIFQTPIGVLSDRIGRKKLIVGGLILSAPLVIGTGYVTSIEQLILLRALQGFTIAAIDTPVIALAGDLSGGDMVGSKLSMITTAYAGGMAIGPIFGGLLAGYVTFETPFYACAALMVIAAAIVWKKVDEPMHHKGIVDFECGEIG